MHRVTPPSSRHSRSGGHAAEELSRHITFLHLNKPDGRQNLKSQIAAIGNLFWPVFITICQDAITFLSIAAAGEFYRGSKPRGLNLSSRKTIIIDLLTPWAIEQIITTPWNLIYTLGN